MNKPNKVTLQLILAVIIMTVSSIAGALILYSSIPFSVKLTALLVIWLVAAVGVGILLLYEKNLYVSSFTNFIQLQDSRIEQLQTAIAKHKAEKGTDTQQIKNKCDQIESFRNQFPLILSPNYSVFNIARTELQVASHSRWLLCGEYENDLWECTVLRPDVQTHDEMLELVKTTTQPEDLKELDQSQFLLWK